jgi:L-rhamnose isomerase
MKFNQKIMNTNNTGNIQKSYEIARERYAATGVNADEALAKLQKIAISIHCWQADDVNGFENLGNLGGGGIQATGNYPGKARSIDEVRADIEKVLTLVAGSHRLNLHEIYGDFQGKVVDRDAATPEHFTSWIEWAKEKGLKLDFNSTSFGHPKSGDLTLASPDKAIRDFWIEHTKRCRLISEEMGKAQNDPCIMNIWVHDGSKDITVNRFKYRQILEQSLDEIFAIEYKNMKDCIEAKLFGIALESYTVGSYDFYLGYGAKKQKIVTLDTGHFHLTESIADKISSLLLFTPEIMLHVSRPIRWDSDHVTILNDDTTDLAKEVIRANALNKVHIGLDYFDASINRIGAYVIGIRSTQKAFLQGLLEPIDTLRRYEENGQYFERLALLEEAKGLPWNAVWDYFCLKNNIPVAEDYITEIQKYEKEITSKRYD